LAKYQSVRHTDAKTKQEKLGAEKQTQKILPDSKCEKHSIEALSWQWIITQHL